MKRKTDDKSLLDDVLGEAAPPHFREALLGETLGLVRRRRRFRRMRNAAGVVAALALAATLAWHRNAKQNPIAIAPPAKKAVEQSYTMVATQPLTPDHIVPTSSFEAPQIITSRATVDIVQTTAGNFHSINDEELLALTAAHPAILVRTGPHSEMLVFANPQDTRGFPAN
jgi:hypothetical protein